MLFHLKSYLKFVLKSTNEHGVHSPFVFALLTKCFYDKKRHDSFENLKQYRRQLKENKSEINVTDFGAGSRIFNSDKRRVCDIAKNAGISKKRAELLYRLTKYLKPQNILEIGTSLGTATAAMAEGNPEAAITTLEGCMSTSEVALKMFKKFEYQNIGLVTTEFDLFFRSDKIKSAKFDLIYFDGNHTKSATLSYFESLLPTVTNETCWIFDDIHWSAEMESAWEIIKKNPAVTVTIDTWQWGIIFFRKEQQKENFTVRV